MNEGILPYSTGENGFELDNPRRSQSCPSRTGGDDSGNEQGDKGRWYLGGNPIEFGYRLIR